MALTADPAKRSCLFIDESGVTGGGSPQDELRRYLCLFGCVVSNDDHVGLLAPAIDALKHRHIPRHRTTPVCLHRVDIRHHRGPFGVLRDPEKEGNFNVELLQLFKVQRYIAICVVVDKEADRVRASRYYDDPYHYALALLLERFVGLLKVSRRVGNTVVEARGVADDRRLEQAYHDVFAYGTRYHKAAFFQGRLRSARPQFRGKADRVAGLELADLLAHPAKCDVLADHGLCPRRDGTFAREVQKVLAEKYNRRWLTGRVEGYGKVLLTEPPS
jgi:hypothetical protein